MDLRVENEKLETGNGPLVVVDRNILSYGRPEQVLPTGGEVVLPDAYFHEMAEAKRDEELDGFVSWIRKHAKTVWISRYCWDLIEDERRSHTLTLPAHVVSEEWTEALRAHATDGEFAWPGDERQEFYEKCKKELVERSRAWTEYVTVNDVDLSGLHSSEEALIEFLRDPSPIRTPISKWDSHLTAKTWAPLIGDFPDRPALCRWWRIINYYNIMYSLGETADFENNWEDAHYAFTASYVGRFATNDHRLIQMMERIFPAVEIFSSPLECPLK